MQTWVSCATFNYISKDSDSCVLCRDLYVPLYLRLWMLVSNCRYFESCNWGSIIKHETSPQNFSLRNNSLVVQKCPKLLRLQILYCVASLTGPSSFYTLFSVRHSYYGKTRLNLNHFQRSFYKGHWRILILARFRLHDSRVDILLHFFSIWLIHNYQTVSVYTENTRKVNVPLKRKPREAGITFQFASFTAHKNWRQTILYYKFLYTKAQRPEHVKLAQEASCMPISDRQQVRRGYGHFR